MAKKPEQEQAEPQEGDSKPKKSLTIMVVAALMLVEGVAVYFAVDYFSDHPATVAAEVGADSESDPSPDDGTEELEVANCRSVNNKEGRLYHYHIRVSVLIPKDRLAFLTELVKKRRHRIDERVNVVVRSAEPKQLNEPGFESLKRRLRAELGDIFGDDDLILEVFIPELIRTSGGV